jgi:hypothetical protein
MKHLIISLLFLILSLQQAYSTHLKAGEITAEKKSGSSYRITLTIYLDSLALVANSNLDEPVAILFINGNKSPNIPRLSKISIGHGTWKNTYVLDNYVLSPGIYKVSYSVDFRNQNIRNINGGVNTESVPFYLETSINVDPFVGPNKTPVLLVPPIDVATVGEKFIHNPAAFDAEGDSISFQLIKPKQSGTTDVPRYVDPNLAPPSAAAFTLNPVTGDLIWDAPVLAGRYNVAFLIVEWRNGEKLSIIERDMQIEVINSLNDPPVLGESIDTCIVAGTSFSKIISATDPNTGDRIYLTSSNTPPAGMYALSSSPPAFVLTNGPNPEASPAEGIFTWNTNCSHIRSQPYQVEFRAEDAPVNPSSLVDFQYLRITIVGPAPTGLSVGSPTVPNVLNISWDPYPCPDAGAKMEIYRRECDTTALTLSPCQTGVPSNSGFVKVGEVPINTAHYTDSIGLRPGNNYCYIVVAAFAAPGGGKSYPSNLSCSPLFLDQPVMLNVSVIQTDSINGKIMLRWTQPQPPPFPLPVNNFEYVVLRSNSIPGTIYDPIDTIVNINQTSMVDSLLNTQELSYDYKVMAYHFGNGLDKASEAASSVFLTVTPGNQKAFLSWTANVPWSIEYFRIFRTLGATTVLVDSVMADPLNNSTGVYVDTGLVNKDTVCYYVESVGKYCDKRFVSPLKNSSEEFCVVPRDTTPPCPPVLFIKAIDCNAPQVFENDLNWINDWRPVCNHDIKGYNLYYAQYDDEAPAFLKFIPKDTFYVDIDSLSLSGCYEVTVINYYGVESARSNRVCMDNCSYYKLPNLITVNGDFKNDLFKPYPVPRNVEKVDFFVYNIWGELVYHSKNDINLNWSGVTGNGNELNEGVYYYAAKVKYYRRLRKQDERVNLKGWIHLIRGDGEIGK